MAAMFCLRKVRSDRLRSERAGEILYPKIAKCDEFSYRFLLYYNGIVYTCCFLLFDTSYYSLNVSNIDRSPDRILIIN